jgi:nicotinamide/nicotinate riboside kinase
MLANIIDQPCRYVDEIVWPNYVHDHKFLFQNGDVEQELDESVCRRVGINGMPRRAEGNMTICLEWAVGALSDAIKNAYMDVKSR